MLNAYTNILYGTMWKVLFLKCGISLSNLVKNAAFTQIKHSSNWIINRGVHCGAHQCYSKVVHLDPIFKSSSAVITPMHGHMHTHADWGLLV